MKKGCLVFFVVLISIFLVSGIIAGVDQDYKEVIREIETSSEDSAVLTEDIGEDYQNEEDDE